MVLEPFGDYILGIPLHPERWSMLLISKRSKVLIPTPGSILHPEIDGGMLLKEPQVREKGRKVNHNGSSLMEQIGPKNSELACRQNQLYLLYM